MCECECECECVRQRAREVLSTICCACVSHDLHPQPLYKISFPARHFTKYFFQPDTTTLEKICSSPTQPLYKISFPANCRFTNTSAKPLYKHSLRQDVAVPEHVRQVDAQVGPFERSLSLSHTHTQTQTQTHTHTHTLTSEGRRHL